MPQSRDCYLIGHLQYVVIIIVNKSLIPWFFLELFMPLQVSTNAVISVSPLFKNCSSLENPVLFDAVDGSRLYRSTASGVGSKVKAHLHGD